MNPLEKLMPQGGMGTQSSPLGGMMPQGQEMEAPQDMMQPEQGMEGQGMSEEDIRMIEEIIAILKEMSPEELEKAIAENPELGEFLKALEEAQAMTQGGMESQMPQQDMQMGGM